MPATTRLTKCLRFIGIILRPRQIRATREAFCWHEGVVGACWECRWNFEAQRPRGPEVNREFVVGRCLHRTEQQSFGLSSRLLSGVLRT